MGGGCWYFPFAFFFSPRSCHSLPIQFHSSPLPLTPWCQSDMFKCSSYVITFLVYLKKKKKVISWTLLLPLQAFQGKSKNSITWHNEVLQTRLSLSPRTHTLSQLPNSPLTFAEHPSAWSFGFHPCLYKYHPLFFKTLPASPTGDQTIKFFLFTFLFLKCFQWISINFLVQ